MILKFLVEGGSMTPGPSLAQQLGPIGINIGSVISKVNEATSAFKGIKVPVELDINPSTKEFKITLKSPPVAELIKKELKLEKASGDQKNIKVGNISIEQIIGIAKTKLSEALEHDLKSMVKTVVGTCVSLGVLIDNKTPVKVANEISEGKYDKEIKEGKTIPSTEKRKELEDYFSEIKKTQDAKIKAEQEAKAAEEAKETLPTTPTSTTSTTDAKASTDTKKAEIKKK